MPDVADPLGTLTEAVDALIASDPLRFADRDSITALYRQLSRVEAAVARASAAFDAGREWDCDRARSAADGSEGEAEDDVEAREVYLSDGFRGRKELKGTLDPIGGRICELANGVAVTPGSLLPYLAEAWVERVVFGGPSRVVDIGQRRRLFTGATRRAVMVRDRECFHPFCEIPTTDCQVDHIEPYAAGGLTTHDNGRAACGVHNRDRHRRT